MSTMRICGREANCGNTRGRGCACGDQVRADAEQKPRKVPETPVTAPVAPVGVVERVLGHLGVAVPTNGEIA